MLRFRLGRIPIAIGGSFALVSILIALPRRDVRLVVEWLLVVFASVLVHELGHAAAARAFGLEPRVELHGMGGTTSFRPPAAFPAWRRVVIALAGPFAGFALGGLVYLWFRLAPAETGTLASWVQRDLLWANLGWGALNLLPIAPLDGGHVLIETLRGAFGRRGVLVGRAISIACAAALAVVSLVYGWIVGAFLCVWILISSVRSAVADAGWERDRKLEPLVEQGKRALERDDGREAIRIAREGLKHARTAQWRRVFALIMTQGALLADDAETAVEGLGLFPDDAPPDPAFRGAVLLRAGRAADAVDLLREAMRDAEARGEGAHERHLLDEALFRSGRYRESAAIAERGFELHRDPRFAYNAACSHARDGQPGRALDWIARAVDAGWSDLESLITDPDLAAVRVLSGWDAVVDRISIRART